MPFTSGGEVLAKLHVNDGENAHMIEQQRGSIQPDGKFKVMGLFPSRTYSFSVESDMI